MPWEGSKIPATFDLAPLLVFWEVTRACGLSCRHCRAAAIEQALPGELSTEEGMDLIRGLSEFGPRQPVLILTGGDALMRKDVLALASLATSQGMPLALAPSVTPLLTEEVVHRAKALGVRAMSVSLDGATPTTHDGIRGVPGHHERTLAAIEMLVRSGLTVQINTAVMRRNVEELAAIAELVGTLGAQIWEVFFLIKVGRGAEIADITPDENEDVAHFLCDASRYGFIVRTVEAPFFRRVVASRRTVDDQTDVARHFTLGPLYERLSADLRRRLGEPTSEERAQTAGTRDGKGILFVAHDGEVYPSGFLPMSLGNVRSRSIVAIYRDHPTLRSIRRAEFGGRCGVCEHKDLCGGSRARAYAATGDPLAEDPACAYVPGPRGLR